MSAAPDEALSNAADWIKSEATTATRPGQMASLDRLADVVEEGAYRLAALVARAEAAEAKVARVEALAEEFAHEHAATIDGEWGCCHDEAALRAGGRAPLFDGDEFDPLPAACPGKRHLDRDLSRLRASPPAPTEDANGRQIGSDERVGTKEDA